MLRRLIVMRHAKSAWDTDAETDHERPLNKRGRRDAPRVGHALVTRGWVPDRVLSSDSLRTRETWERMRGAFEPPPPVRFSRGLYHASIGPVQQHLEAVDDDVETLLVLGHNPGWESVVAFLTGTPTRMKTATAALLHTCAPGWREASQQAAGWSVEDVIYPRELA